MRRGPFLARLEQGLQGLDPRVVGEILADYENYFAEGTAAGRDEAELAAALGSPARVATELRLASRSLEWRRKRNAPAAARLALSLAGLVLVDLLAAAPVAAALVAAAGVLLASVVALLIGGFLLIAGLNGAGADALRGGGLIAAAAAGGAASALALIGLADAAGWWARLHGAVIRPHLNRLQEAFPP